MSSISGPPPLQYKVPSPESTLRKLFLTVFIRGRSSRGITKETAPKSITSALWIVLGVYGLFGATVLFMIGQPVLVISIMLHAITFLALGMFIATSAGEALFNKDESEILMHRPVTSKMLLRAKTMVLVQISLYLAAAINFIGLWVGLTASEGNPLFIFAHLFSTVEEALFCTGIVVLLYQICLRSFGRERLEGVMTTMQVLVIVSITAGSQILPRVIGMNHGLSSVKLDVWWVKLLPPAWFASVDDAVAGTHSGTSWLLAGLGVIATAGIFWLAFGRLAAVYETGWQSLNEAERPKANQGKQYRFVKACGESAPLKWFLRSSVSQASFQLVAAYLFRDRDTKLRVYPGIAPAMIMPIMLLVMNQGFGDTQSKMQAYQAMRSHSLEWMSGFYIAMSAAFMCNLPLSALNLLRFSQQWRASEVFVAAPIVGPAPILQGARVAVLFFLGFPMVFLLTLFVAFTQKPETLCMVLVGVIAMPVYAMIPGILSNATPLSSPMEEAKSMNNFPILMLSMFGSFGVAGLATAALALGMMPLFLLLETIVSAGLCYIFYKLTAKAAWRTYD